MVIVPARGARILDATLSDLEPLLATDDARGEFLIVEGPDGALQVAGEGFGPLILEFIPTGDSLTILRATDERLSFDTIKPLLRDFLSGGSSWRTSLEWRELTLEPRPRLLRWAGIGVVLLLALALVLAGCYALATVVGAPLGLNWLIAIELGGLAILLLIALVRIARGTGRTGA